ncbi:MAG: hypothetical protein H0U76_13585 [Ktedonobacteraceae bacterium]|nr:hypothetical protein [Ktedonobacteraceae bacterium]
MEQDRFGGKWSWASGCKPVCAQSIGTFGGQMMWGQSTATLSNFVENFFNTEAEEGESGMAIFVKSGYSNHANPVVCLI